MMKTSSAKAKGRALQQWVRDLLLSLSSSLHKDDVRSTSMGAGGEDVLLSPAARSLFPVSIECKNLARFAGYTLYDQAVANCPDGNEPVVVVKANRRSPLVMVDAEYYFKLMHKTSEKEQHGNSKRNAQCT